MPISSPKHYCGIAHFIGYTLVRTLWKCFHIMTGEQYIILYLTDLQMLGRAIQSEWSFPLHSRGPYNMFLCPSYSLSLYPKELIRFYITVLMPDSISLSFSLLYLFLCLILVSLCLGSCVCPYRSPGAAPKANSRREDLQETQEVDIVIAEALAKHQSTDDVGHGAAQEECGVKWGT